MVHAHPLQLAGVAGLEPANDGVKVRCVTASPYPILSKWRAHRDSNPGLVLRLKAFIYMKSSTLIIQKYFRISALFSNFDTTYIGFENFEYAREFDLHYGQIPFSFRSPRPGATVFGRSRPKRRH